MKNKEEWNAFNEHISLPTQATYINLFFFSCALYQILKKEECEEKS
jgi:hypothetical protein